MATAKRKPMASVSNVKLMAECIDNNHKWQMTNAQIEQAQEVGMAICPTCGSVAVVARIAIKV